MRNFEWPVVSIDRVEYDAIKDWAIEYKKRIGDRKLYIYGAGIRGCMFWRILEDFGIDISGFIDGSKEKQGGCINKYTIYSPEEMLENRNKIVVLISPENSADIVSSLERRDYLRDKDYYVIEKPLYEEYVKEFFKVDDYKSIFMGDCFFPDVDINDLGSETMGEIIKKELGVNKTKVLTMHGMCMPSFYHLLKQQIKLGVNPKVVCFIVNIPFFGGIQTKLPRAQHPELMKMILERLPYEDKEFRDYVEITEVRSHNIDKGVFVTGEKTRENRLSENIDRIQMKMHYMYTLREDNESMIYLGKILDFLKKNEINAVPFIPAINYSVGVSYYGEEFKRRYDAICEKIKKYVSKWDIEIADLSYLLDKTNFHGGYMTKFPLNDGKRKETQILIEYCQKYLI